MYNINCPHCDTEIKIDYIESDEWQEECPECNEYFEVNVEYDPILNTRKYNMVKCIICKSKFDKTWHSRYPMPHSFKSTDDICNNCFNDLTIKDFENQS